MQTGKKVGACCIEFSA